MPKRQPKEVRGLVSLEGCGTIHRRRSWSVTSHLEEVTVCISRAGRRGERLGLAFLSHEHDDKSQQQSYADQCGNE
ncbi:MAG TPA: hypothetical protein VGR96_19110 [Acidobacteriaceae bacterium]|nr:hypothetical protein [Acidobacteriaceae bacterium]